MQKRTIGLWALLAGMVTVPASADPFPLNLPAAETFVKCSGQTGAVVSEPYSQSCTGTYGESATGDLSGASARAAGTALDGTLNGGGGAAAQTSYYFAIVPPAGFDLNVQVPVRIDALLTAGATGTEGDFLDHTYGSAGLLVSTGNITDLGEYVCAGFCEGPSTINGSWTLDLYALAANEVTLSAAISLHSMLQSSASGLADPYIQIDPAFLASHPGFSIVLSDGIPNTPPGGGGGATVPEPATVWPLGIGLLALAKAARRASR